MDRITCNGASVSLILLINSFLYDDDAKSDSFSASFDVTMSLHTTTRPQDVMDIAVDELSMKVVSTNRKLMETARAGKCC